MEVLAALLAEADALTDVGLLRESQDYRCGFLTVRSPMKFDAPLGLHGDVIFSCLKGAEGVRRLVDRLSGMPGILATAVQTVGVKGWDGFILALVT